LKSAIQSSDSLETATWLSLPAFHCAPQEATQTNTPKPVSQYAEPSPKCMPLTMVILTAPSANASTAVLIPGLQTTLPANAFCNATMQLSLTWTLPSNPVSSIVALLFTHTAICLLVRLSMDSALNFVPQWDQYLSSRCLPIIAALPSVPMVSTA